MCWVCDHPGSTEADYFTFIRGIIDRCGWAIQGIERERNRPPWAYTVGLTVAGKPELVVTGLSLTKARKVLNSVAAYALRTVLPRPGELVELVGGPMTQIVKVDHPDVHLETATGLYGPRIRALQVVHADDRGRWPWESGYRGIRGGQPVLGIPVAPQRARQQAHQQ